MSVDDIQDGIRIKVRSGRDMREAHPFVLSCWLKSYEARGCRTHGLDHDSSRDRRAYYNAHHPEFTRLLHAGRLALACVEEDHDTYVGWALGAEGLLHYVFVKSSSRDHGIARRLVRAIAGDGPIVYTFEPGKSTGRPNASLLAVAQRHGWRFHPHPVPGMAVRKQREGNA